MHANNPMTSGHVRQLMTECQDELCRARVSADAVAHAKRLESLERILERSLSREAKDRRDVESSVKVYFTGHGERKATC